MRTLLTLVLLSVSSLLMAQKSNLDSVNTDHSVLQAFISQLADQDIAVDIILSQYMNIEHPTADIYDYLEVSLEEIRINLMTKNIADILYIPYNKMAKKDIKDIDVDNLYQEKNSRKQSSQWLGCLTMKETFIGQEKAY